MLLPAFQVVCLTNGYHTGCIMATHGKLVHAQRLCQAAALRLQLKAQYVRPDGRPSHAYMQVGRSHSFPLCERQV